MNGSRLAAGCNEGSVYVWAYPTAEIVYKVQEHRDWIETLFWSPFKEHLFASCHIVISLLFNLFNFLRLTQIIFFLDP